ncbi:MAG: glycosyltransferase family 2 protein [Actinomycetota bacterium]
MGTSPPVADVTAVVVNFNSGERLQKLLSLLSEEVIAVVVVDNASSDGSAATPDSPSVKTIRNESNEGFAAAANRGAARASSSWILFVNADVHTRAGQVAALVEGLDGSTAVVAPLQIDGRGEPLQESGGYRPGLGRFLLWSVLPGSMHGRFGPWLAAPFPIADTGLPWVSGAMIAVRRDVFESTGGFDERFFLFLEDVDLCRRIGTLGYRVVLRGSIRVRHEVGQGDPARRQDAMSHYVESLGILFNGWRRRALGLILLLGFGIRSILSSEPARSSARAAIGPSTKLLFG